MNSKWLWSKLNILKSLYAYQRLDWSHVFLLKPTKDPALAACSVLPSLSPLNGHKSAGWRIELELDPALVKRNNAQ